MCYILVVPNEQPVVPVAAPHERLRVSVPALFIHAAVPIEGVEENAGKPVQNLQKYSRNRI